MTEKVITGHTTAGRNKCGQIVFTKANEDFPMSISYTILLKQKTAYSSLNIIYICIYVQSHNTK